MVDDMDYADGLREGLEEALAWTRGEIALEVVNIEPMPAERIKAIRKRVAPSVKKFAARYGLPVSTVNNWEQGRRHPDPAARLLLKTIEMDPDLVARAAAAGGRREGRAGRARGGKAA
jgi:putative transcriptional regulator